MKVQRFTVTLLTLGIIIVFSVLMSPTLFAQNVGGSSGMAKGAPGGPGAGMMPVTQGGSGTGLVDGANPSGGNDPFGGSSSVPNHDPIGGDWFGTADPFGDRRTKIVILLGPDYDFSKPPFQSSDSFVEMFNSQNSQVLELNQVTIDIETPLPNEPLVTVFAAYPSDDADEVELKKYRKRVQLSALRFGINHIELVPRAADRIRNESDSLIWIRVPYYAMNDDAISLQKYYLIATYLAESFGGNPRQPRMEVFDATSFQDDPNAATPKISLPLATVAETGELQGRANRNDLAPATVVEFQNGQVGPISTFYSEPPVNGNSDKTIGKHAALLSSYDEALIDTIKTAVDDGKTNDEVREIVTKYVTSILNTRTELQREHLKQLEAKLERLRTSIEEREQDGVKRSMIDNRVNQWMSQIYGAAN